MEIYTITLIVTVLFCYLIFNRYHVVTISKGKKTEKRFFKKPVDWESGRVVVRTTNDVETNEILIKKLEYSQKLLDHELASIIKKTLNQL